MYFKTLHDKQALQVSRNAAQSQMTEGTRRAEGEGKREGKLSVSYFGNGIMRLCLCALMVIDSIYLIHLVPFISLNDIVTHKR